MQLTSVLTTEDVPPAERFGLWTDMLARAAMPVDVRTEHTASFDAKIVLASLGPIELMNMEHPPLNVRRTPRLIRQSDPDVYHLVLSLAGEQWLSQDRREVVLRPGDMTLYHSSHAMETRTDEALDRESAIVVMIPSAALRLPARRVRDVVATRFPGENPLTSILTSHLHALLACLDRLSPAQGAQLSTVTLELICQMLAQRTDGTSALSPESRERALFDRVLSFVESELHDVHLTPGSLAVAHHISVRSLHRLFQDRGVTVADWIRRRRLEHCRKDLADPALAGRSVADIAARWGLRDHTLSRAFKAVYGISPSAYRDDTAARDEHDRSQPGR